MELDVYLFGCFAYIDGVVITDYQSAIVKLNTVLQDKSIIKFMHNSSIKEIWQDFKHRAQGKSAVSRFIIMTFAVVAIALEWMARKLHITYNEINVIVYYWLIPMSWTLLLDYKLDAKIDIIGNHGFFPILTIMLCSAWAGIILSNFRFFSKWCDYVFKASQDFLCLFNRWGGNYVLNSVVICVVVPLIIYIILLVI